MLHPLLRRYDGWVTELKDEARARNVADVAGIDNLLYSADVDFSCFADLAVTSPEDYRKEGEGSLMQARTAVRSRAWGIAALLLPCCPRSDVRARSGV